jgi:pyruvate dehydrogenase E2 component (dihydrolipoamide acetyltransferase)
MESCAALREELKELGSAVSLNDFVLKAAALGLRKVPEVNRSFVEGKFLQHGHADVGMAVALPDGLVTPVLHDADLLPLGQIAALARDFAERARSKRLKPEEYSGGSVTVSNLGMFGVDQFFAVINPPQSAILAVGKVLARPVVWEGQVVARQRMWLSLSGDHRAIDGALGARYLGAVREALERPVALMV